MPAISMDQLHTAIDPAYSAAAAEFTAEELRSLRSESEIRQFILQSHCVVFDRSPDCIQRMIPQEEPER